MSASADHQKELVLETMQSVPSSEEPQGILTDEQIDDAIDPALERRVRWKLDLTILPLLTSVQFLAQMVRMPSEPKDETNNTSRLNLIWEMPKSLASVKR